ncbi:sugar phosphate isomerase/epimerase [Arachidicoccus ginsenosidivorans]|uniref:Sugar phosphate isomerase/epimerase n=1 Tax=Arachidicoccus ginsenosidivorans TaxID=496057 RepID=A0A5B8VUD0_9BACT|nr:sugar phosphate isomerase/epimerase [Arachidicoccus ginsenosidivorans]
MKLQFYCPRWGAEDLPWSAFCKKVKQSGYDGIEAAVPEQVNERAEMTAALKANGLLFIGQYFQSFEKDFDAHQKNYLRYLHLLASAAPVKINAQTGKDYFSFEQNASLIQVAADFSEQTGIKICHETHRNKALFAAHVAHSYLQQLPNLSITADFSHWCSVAESLLEDQKEAMALACKRVEHLHARIGHAQGAQVIDPRLPLYQRALAQHLGWWDAVVSHYRKEGRRVLTVTPEFGPAPYMVQLPFTQMPIANQYEINVYMMQLLKNRYEA